ncbi:MAG: amidohydrolase [Oscillospiraceae bacterium]|nr:amidohydrolase [Oscillospiraceae bacterium]
MQNRPAMKAIEEKSADIIALATKIWENPEMGWKEFQAMEWTAEFLRQNGFAVETGAFGVPTAIRAVWGSGKPVIGICGEYDCLPGLSQKLTPNPDPVVAGGDGHGCGHNLLGAGSAAACIGLKAELEASGLSGTVVFYGCPAEEQTLGKGYMAKGGAFTECDVTFEWHPEMVNEVPLGTMNGVESAMVRFKGRTAHAAGNPQDGRSALDAAQLFCLGVEFMREHVTDDVRMHYIYTDGGLAPNIVPDTAAVKIIVRAKSRDAVLDAFGRVLKCAEGASIMTETQLEIERLGGLYPTLQNKVLAHHVHRVFSELPEVEYTEEELAFCDAINRHNPLYKEGTTPPIRPEVLPLAPTDLFASTDYGDVMHIRPSLTINVVTSPTLCSGHSWMMTASVGSSVGMKGMLQAAKLIAIAAHGLCEDPSIVEAAKAEFDEVFKTRKPYESPITDAVKCPFA